MKRVPVIALLTVLSLAGRSQYKKAEFFSSKGRTVGIGATSLIMGDGKATPVGFYIEGSRESPDSRFFSFANLLVIPSYQFSYQTPGESYGQPDKSITVTGKTTMHFLYQFNMGYFLLDPKNEELKFKPYVSLGANALLAGRVKDYTYEEGYSINRYPGSQSFSFGFRAGGGCIYALSERFSLKLDAGYTYQINMDGLGNNGSNNYYVFGKHAAVGLGIRYSIYRE